MTPPRPVPAPAAAAPARGPGRLALIDALRGGALAAMALYHLAWDLGFLRLTPENVALAPAGRGAAHAIAGSFLLLVGASLVLAQGGGLAQGRGLAWRPFLARLARIAGAAALISLATRFAFPDSWIFFGILHAIALSSVLALPALRAPLPLVGLGAAAILAARPLLAWSGAAPPVLDAPLLLFLGLGRGVPTTNDYVPLVPWFGLVLAGVLAGRLALPRLAGMRLLAWRPRGPGGRLLAAAGRHSLAVYLVHQPLLLGLLAGLAALTGPHPRAGQAQFLREYRANCTAAGGGAPACRLAARCLLADLRREGLWQAAERGAFSPGDRARALVLSQACYREAGGP
nr:heparan-alpha-glucosaminide N-acetyltransferase [Methylobacterium crusticola]